jgi:hypothetical protein
MAAIGPPSLASILKPPLHGLGTEPDQVPELAVGQAFLSKFGHMADAASRVAGDVINGPKVGGGCWL